MVGVSIKASAGISNSDADPAVDGDSEANSLDSGVHSRDKRSMLWGDFSQSRLRSGLRDRGLEGFDVELLVGVAVAVPLVDDIAGRVVRALVVLVNDLEETSYDGDDLEVLGVGIVNTPVPVSVSVVGSVTLKVEDEVVDVVESVEASVGGELEFLSVGSIAVL